MKRRRFAVMFALAAAIAAFAGTETFNDLAPYDNTIVNTFWDTTRHPARNRYFTTGGMDEFDSKICDVKTVDLQSFDSCPAGLFIIFH